jgi:hypothetical protein
MKRKKKNELLFPTFFYSVIQWYYWSVGVDDDDVVVCVAYFNSLTGMRLSVCITHSVIVSKEIAPA